MVGAVRKKNPICLGCGLQVLVPSSTVFALSEFITYRLIDRPLRSHSKAFKHPAVGKLPYRKILQNFWEFYYWVGLALPGACPTLRSTPALIRPLNELLIQFVANAKALLLLVSSTKDNDNYWGEPERLVQYVRHSVISYISLRPIL